MAQHTTHSERSGPANQRAATKRPLAFGCSDHDHHPMHNRNEGEQRFADRRKIAGDVARAEIRPARHKDSSPLGPNCTSTAYEISDCNSANSMGKQIISTSNLKHAGSAQQNHEHHGQQQSRENRHGDGGPSLRHLHVRVDRIS